MTAWKAVFWTGLALQKQNKDLRSRSSKGVKLLLADFTSRHVRLPFTAYCTLPGDPWKF